MRSCLEVFCEFAARQLSRPLVPERTRSSPDAMSETTGILATALLGLVINNVGCADSRESTDRVGNMRVDSVLDGGATAEAASSCADGNCEQAKLDARWQCPAADSSVRAATVRYSVGVLDFLNNMPRADVKAKACRTNDTRCEDPVATFVDTQQTGRVQLELPTGFTGYIEFTSDGVDTLLYLTKPIVRNTLDRDITVPTPDTIELLVSLLDYQWDMDTGLVVLEMLDCSNTPQGGIHFDCRGCGNEFYMVDGVPFKSEQMTKYDAMSNTAEGGFLNVPPGDVEFFAQVGTDEDAMSLGSLNVQIRPRTLTVIDFHP